MKFEKTFPTEKLYIVKVIDIVTYNTEFSIIPGFLVPHNNIMNYEYYSVVYEYSKGAFIDLINGKKYFKPWKNTIKNIFSSYYEIVLETKIIDLCQKSEVTALELTQILDDYCQKKDKIKTLGKK